MGSKSKNKSKSKVSKPEGNAGAGAGAAALRGGSQQSGSKIIKDPRFASIHTDPRFRKAPKHKSKVVLDSRFSHIFTDKNFASAKAGIDKRGKPKEDRSQSRLKQYYRLEDEGEEALKLDEELKSKDTEIDEEEEEESGSEAGESESESESENEKLKKGNLMSKSDESESEEEEDEEAESDDSSSTSATDSDEEDGVYSEEEDTFVQEENIPEIEKETHRLAVVNMDWGRVKAVDLYVLLSSFLPKGGQIKSVAVYPSEFGLKRMEEEAVHGPVGLFDEEKGKNKNSDDEDDDEIDNEKLRAYELSRLRYYFAVVDCDSSATADYLYKNCDGVEFERTSNKLDLRFIPDSIEFKHEARDVATEAPSSYEGLDFHTRALQHSNIELTWDEDEPQRARSLKRKFNADQLAEMELKEFLASDESEADDDENDDDNEDKPAKKHKKQDMYRALLQSGDGSDGSDKDDHGDMEVTFNTGLEDLSKRILEKKDKQSESVWEAYLRKKKEKKKARKNRSKDSSEDESSEDSDYQEHSDQPDDDFFVEEPSASRNKEVKGKRAKKGKQDQETAEEAEASKAELELLLADENGADANVKGYNLKRRKSKDKKGKVIIDEDKIPSVDYNDPRFSSLFTSPLFALDPTDPQFKRSAVYVRQLAEKEHKVDQENVGRKEQSDITRPQQPSKESNAEELPSRKEKHELSSLVKSIKMKSKQIPLPSQNKVTKKSEKLRAKKTKK
nr:pre-rRNA-processing protein ESF1 [Ipomoea trifida]